MSYAGRCWIPTRAVWSVDVGVLAAAIDALD